jgi:probable addiction module antidote protein
VTFMRAPKLLNAFDAADYLDNEETIAAFLSEAAKDDNPDVFLAALACIARSRGMTEIARKTGLGRQNLYKALAPAGVFPRVAVLPSSGCRLALKLYPGDKTVRDDV